MGPVTTARRRQTGRITASAALAVLVISMVTGCAKERPLLTQADLDARPPITEMQDRYEEMQQRVRAAVDAAIGARPWHENTHRASYGGCGHNFEPTVVGRNVTLPSWQFDRPITDIEWPAVKRAVLDVVGQYGFQPGGMSIDTGGDHELNAYETGYGAYFTIGNKINTVMQVSTGCHPGEWRIYS